MTRIIIAIAFIGFAGCGETEPMAVGPDHPANPQAPTAELPPPTITLSIAQPPATAPSQDAGHEAEHAEHGGPVGGANAASPATQPSATRPTTRAAYACPMHPEVTSDQPGKCPKCGMDLVSEQEGGQ